MAYKFPMNANHLTVILVIALSMSVEDATQMGNYDVKRCYKVNITFHYLFPYGLTSNTIRREKTNFSNLFTKLSGLLVLDQQCDRVIIKSEDMITSAPGESSLFFRIPTVFTASDKIADAQVSSKLTSCINYLISNYQGFLNTNTPSITENGITKGRYNATTIADKESCCGGDTWPPCCAAGSIKVSSEKCACVPGFHYVSNNKLCVRCPSDTYQENPGQKKCDKCPAKKQTFGKTGMTSESNCSDTNPLQLRVKTYPYLPHNIRVDTVVGNVSVTGNLASLVQPFLYYIDSVTQRRKRPNTRGRQARRQSRRRRDDDDDDDDDVCEEAGTIKPQNYFCIYRLSGNIKVTQEFVFVDGEEFDLAVRVTDSDPWGQTENSATVKLISSDQCKEIRGFYDEAVQFCSNVSLPADGDAWVCPSVNCLVALFNWQRALDKSSEELRAECSSKPQKMQAVKQKYSSCIGPPTITLNPVSQTLKKGATAVLTCNASSPMHMKITWFKNGRQVGSGSQLQIGNFQNEDQGEYSCKFSTDLTSIYSKQALIVQQGAWKNVIGSWTDNGTSWTGSIPYNDTQWHYGPARLWTTPVNSDQYVITSRVQVLSGKACGHIFKYKPGAVLTRTQVTKAWGYFLWGGTSMYITSSGPESSPKINFATRSGYWYNLKSEVNGTDVKIYVNNKMVKEITMSGSGADSKNNTYVGLWCHNKIPIKGDSFKVSPKKCSALTVSRFVKTSPNSCVSSEMKINTRCSFSCPHGYQLQGPSHKQCGSRGQWTDGAKTVSCIDIDECIVSNGGCSHKCVNTAGGYKCTCPDPELSLSSDNKTCHAPGVNVQCNSENITIAIPKSLLRGIDREHLRLLDTTCKATETRAHFSLTTTLTGCNTTSRHTPTAIVYSNAVLEIPVAAKDVVTRVREIEIQFSCFYSKFGVVSSVGWKASNRKLVFNDEGQGNFTLSLNMFPDKRFVSPYTKNDFPVDVVLRKLLFFEVSVTSDDKQLSIRAERCYATPTQDQTNPLKYEFIKNGCPNDVTMKYHSAPSVSAQRFSLEAFKFIADHPFVFVYCHVIICNATDPGSKCAKTCSSSGGRGRREVSGQLTDLYSLAQGPLHMAREKREEKHASGLDKSGSSPTIMMTLFLMCAACLVGTALMAFKKSRDKPVGYTVLSTGEQK